MAEKNTTLLRTIYTISKYIHEQSESNIFATMATKLQILLRLSEDLNKNPYTEADTLLVKKALEKVVAIDNNLKELNNVLGEIKDLTLRHLIRANKDEDFSKRRFGNV